MSKNVPETTMVKGYFNPKPYVVQLELSEFNFKVRLEPQQFIVNRATGQKVNDPILDRYVGPHALSPEVSDVPVPVVRIPMTAPRQSTGHIIQVGTKDATGKWQAPAPAPLPPPPATLPDGRPVVVGGPEVQGMSVERARALGLIGKARVVAEDYGAEETSGAPVTGDKIPGIKYSYESRPRAAQAQPAALPQELQAEVATVNPGMQNVIENLQQQAGTTEDGPSITEALRRTAQPVQIQPTPAPAPAPAPQPAAPRPPATPAPRPAPVQAAPRVAEPTRRVATPMPMSAPVLEDEGPLAGGNPTEHVPQGLPAPILDVPESTEPKGETKATIKCGACGKTFIYHSWYKRHVERVHRDRLAELLPQKV